MEIAVFSFKLMRDSSSSVFKSSDAGFWILDARSLSTQPASSI